MRSDKYRSIEKGQKLCARPRAAEAYFVDPVTEVNLEYLADLEVESPSGPAPAKA